MAADWPTHRVKARASKDAALWRKRRNRRLRRLYREGKRGELNG